MRVPTPVRTSVVPATPVARAAATLGLGCGPLAAALLVTLAAAQPATKSNGAKGPPAVEQLPIVTVQVYSERSSRTAFSAIDRSADDRIDIFEFVASQDERTGAGLQDNTAFRRADVDRSGFLDWPEFDQRLRDLVRLSGEFRYRPARSLAPAKIAGQKPVVDLATLDPQTRSLWALLDTDRSGRISRDEFSSLLTSANLPAASMVHFVRADADGDDELDPRELGQLMPLLPALPRGPRTTPSSRSFPPPWRLADRDGDGEVSARELESALRNHDLDLGRWAERIIDDADKSGDHRLGPAEVLAIDPRR